MSRIWKRFSFRKTQNTDETTIDTRAIDDEYNKNVGLGCTVTEASFLSAIEKCSSGNISKEELMKKGYSSGEANALLDYSIIKNLKRQGFL